MTEITLIGLGLMGAGLGRQVQEKGRGLTVWNRSPEKMQPLVEGGAQGAASLAAAVRASPVIAICVADYASTYAMFEDAEVSAALAGRIVAQLTTGTPNEAAECGEWFRERGARYFDAAVLGGPASLDSYARIIFAGPEDDFREAEAVLGAMCRNVAYVGANLRAAAVLDLGWLSRHYGMFVGLTHGVAACEAEGVSLDRLVEVIPEGEYAREYVKRIHEARFDETGATLRTWARAFNLFGRQAADAGISDEFPRLMSNWFERALDAGYGEQDVSALIRIFRDASKSAAG